MVKRYFDIVKIGGPIPPAPTLKTVYNKIVEENKYQNLIGNMLKSSKNWILWILVLGSLAMNFWILGKFLSLEGRTNQGAGEILKALNKAQSGSISYTAHINQNVPISVTVNLDDTITVPINAKVPVKTTVIVPVTIPVINQVVDLNVPINTIVPINTVVSVPVRKTLVVRGSSPIVVDVPVNIPINQTPFADILKILSDWISQIAGFSK